MSFVVGDLVTVLGNGCSLAPVPIPTNTDARHTADHVPLKRGDMLLVIAVEHSLKEWFWIFALQNSTGRFGWFPIRVNDPYMSLSPVEE